MIINQSRDLDDVLDVTDAKQRAKLWKMLNQYDLVLACGIFGTGKTHTLIDYRARDKNTSFWRRKPVMDMLCQDRKYDETYNRYIQNFEREALPKVLENPHNQLVVEGWHRMRSSRRRILSYKQDHQNSCLLVFDSSPELIATRLKEVGHDLKYLDDELEIEAKRLLKTFDWPTFKEGWNKIYYINTFGLAGVDYLSGQPYTMR